jgi:hypothetical protein
MAGSYNHIVKKPSGKFQGVELLDNLGDAWEALEECFGMIWYLADGDAEKVEEARQNYKAGLERSSGVVDA